MDVLTLPSLTFVRAVELSLHLWGFYALLATIELEVVCTRTAYRHFMRTGFGSAGSFVIGGPAQTTFERTTTRRLGLLLRALIAATFFVAPSLVWTPIAGPAALATVVLLNYWATRGMWLASEGSDQMGNVLALCLFLTVAMPASGLLLGPYALMAQLLLSYFVAGVVKWADPRWRSGDAITGVMRTYSFGSPAAARWLGGRFSSVFFGHTTVVWELFTPLIFVGPHWLVVPYFAIGAAFHLGNMLIMRIGAFFFAFVATYPLAIWAVFDLRARLGVSW